MVPSVMPCMGFISCSSHAGIEIAQNFKFPEIFFLLGSLDNFYRGARPQVSEIRE